MSNITFAQTMLVVERPGTVKNYIYQAGQNIRLKTKSGKKISGPINIIKDSSLVVDYVNDLEIKDIAFVYKPRPLLNSFGTFFMGGSLLYIGLGTLNSDNLSENSSFKVAAGFFWCRPNHDITLQKKNAH
jgi:hypothetical protein